MGRKNLIGIFRIFLLTGLLVTITLRPSGKILANELKSFPDIYNSYNFLALSKSLNPKLIQCFLKRLPDFLPFARNKVVTIIDYSLPSTYKRLWTINLETGKLLFYTFVAHGRNTGENVAEKFSNKPQSYQSSLGFFLTDHTYKGKNGNSLRLQGLEKNINDKALERDIVVHGAPYVSEGFIKTQGRLGRSLGCPAIPPEITDDFIKVVKEGSLLFIYHPSYESFNNFTATNKS